MIHNLEHLSEVVCGRRCDLFLDEDFAPALAYKRALFLGGAGFIGQATIDAFLAHGRLEHISVVDLNENNLTEVVRNVRCQAQDIGLSVSPVDMAGEEMPHFLAAQDPYDIVLIFAALKHVRSERDFPSLHRMWETNVNKVAQVVASVRHHSPGCRIFYCSTDKAADPVSAMGATKRWGESLVLKAGNATCARFANVAFSDGSLPDGFLKRMNRNQRLSAPHTIKRYLISPAEAGRLCLLAATCPNSGAIVVPNLHAARHTVDFVQIARRLMYEYAYKQDMLDITDPDTAGEKDMEVFHGTGENVHPWTKGLSVVFGPVASDPEYDFEEMVSKEALLAHIAKAVPWFRHQAGPSLDGRR